jgi:hypothetical protein
MNKPKSIYKIIFLNQGRIYELYARSGHQGNLYGFVEVEELIFGEKSALLVNPAEEKLQSEFSGVRRAFIPLHSVIRIDEVEKEGVSKIREKGEVGDNVAFLPNMPYPPGGNRKD